MTTIGVNMKKVLILVLLVLNSFSLSAKDEFSLESAKKQLVNDNINIAISYQNYVSVKEQSRVKMLQLLPTITVDLLVSDYQYTILRSIIPEPTKYFDALAAQSLAGAANLNRVIVKKNLLEDLEKSYFLFQFHKETVESLQSELSIRKVIAERSKEAFDLGAISFDDFYLAQRFVVAAKTNLVNATEVLKNDEFTLKLLLQSNDLSEFDLMVEDLYNASLAFPADVNEAMDIAVKHSLEVEQFDYLIQAARKTKTGVAVSWISWGGVGFDYFAKVSVARSEIKKLQLQKEKAIIGLRNQVATIYAEIEKLKEKLTFHNELLEMSKNEYARAQENYNNQLGTLLTLKAAEISLINVQRDSRRMQYDLELKYLKLKRVIGANMLTNEIPKI